MVTALTFLRAIADDPADSTNRLVFADWLEEHGDGRAEFVRLDCELRRLAEGEEPPADAKARWEALRPGVPAEWLIALGREPVERCEVALTFRCPRTWENLAPTAVATERHCDECGQTVYRCDTVAKARTRAALGQCVAVDAGLIRTPGDLDPETGLRVGGIGLL